MDYNRLLNTVTRDIKPSGIRRFFDLAGTMEGVISLGVGEPDFKTPLPIRETAIETLREGHITYTANAGVPALKAEIATYLDRRFGLSYDPATELFVTVGGSEAIDMCIRAVVNPGDEVLVVEPCFVCYAPIAALCQAKVIPIATKAENDFRLTADELRAVLTPKTKLLVLPFPNNPTGGVMLREHLEEIAGLLRGTDTLVLSDEIYAELTYGAKHTSIATLPGMRERTIVVNGFSKAYAMTGWRLGYACGPEPIISQMLKIHQFAVMCAPTVSQNAAITALRECDGDIEAMCGEYDARRRMMVDRLNAMGLSCFEPRGAFYVFPSIQSTGLSSVDFCEQLLEAKKVAVVPGDAFGESGEGFVRICYAYSTEHLTTALDRMEEFLRERSRA